MNIPKIALGTGGIMKRNNNLIDMLKVVKEFKYKHIDTAHVYRNEIQVGKDLKELKWEDSFVTTKVEVTNMKYHTRENVLESIKAIGHIDLVLLHGPVSRGVNAIAFKELIKLREEGLIKGVGVSNFEINQIKELHEDTGVYPVNNQIWVTPTHCNQELIDFCQSKGIVVSAFSPLGSYYRVDSELYMSKDQRDYIDSLGAKYNKSASNIIFRWLLDKDINVVFQSRKPERVRDNFNVDDFNLAKEEVDKIDSFDSGKRFVEMPIPTEEQSVNGSFIFK